MKCSYLQNLFTLLLYVNSNFLNTYPSHRFANRNSTSSCHPLSHLSYTSLSQLVFVSLHCLNLITSTASVASFTTNVHERLICLLVSFAILSQVPQCLICSLQNLCINSLILLHCLICLISSYSLICLPNLFAECINSLFCLIASFASLICPPSLFALCINSLFYLICLISSYISNASQTSLPGVLIASFASMPHLPHLLICLTVLTFFSPAEFGMDTMYSIMKTRQNPGSLTTSGSLTFPFTWSTEVSLRLSLLEVEKEKDV